jgi:hypothetical protein
MLISSSCLQVVVGKIPTVHIRNDHIQPIGIPSVYILPFIFCRPSGGYESIRKALKPGSEGRPSGRIDTRIKEL